MIHLGWEIDSHTVHHIDLVGLSTAALRVEVFRSRRKLQRLFHQPVDFFCYPSGRYDAAAVASVRQAGYLGATTTNLGIGSRSSNPYLLPRIRVQGGERTPELHAQLSQLR
jgi:peptidoglycan/xylan/chitin deacetylase (PgdA/CDA1 family)